MTKQATMPMPGDSYTPDEDVAKFLDAAEAGNLDEVLASLGEEADDAKDEDGEQEQPAAADAEGSKSETEEGGAGETDDATDEDETKPDASAEEKTDDAEGEADPVVLTADGKNTIPYEVVRNLRSQVTQLQTELHSLKKGGEAGEEGKQDTGKTEAILKGLDLDAMEEEYGADLVNPMRVLVGAVEQLQGQVAEARDAAAAYQRDRQAEQQLSTEEAIDAVFSDSREAGQKSVLRQWLDDDAPEWHAAVAIDQRLLDDPQWGAASEKDRFEEVLRRMGQAPQPKPTSPSKPATPPTRKDDGPAPPTSLSDLPGGTPPAQSATEAAENMTDAEMMAKYQRLLDQDPHKAAEWLEGLGAV